MSDSKLECQIAVLRKALAETSPTSLPALSDAIKRLIETLKVDPYDVGLFESIEEVMAKKIERARRIQQYLGSLEGVAEKCSCLEMMAIERQNQRARTLRTNVEEQQRLDRAEEAIERERQIAVAEHRVALAKYEAEIAKYEAEASQYRTSMKASPAPAADKDPVAEARSQAEVAKHQAEEAKYKREARDANREPVPPRSKKELNAERLQRLRDEIEQSKRDEEREIEAATRGAAEEDWPSEVKDEVARIRTRYASLRDRKRGEMEELS